MVNADIVRVEAQTSPTVSPQQQLSAALSAHSGEAFRYVPPASPVHAAEVDITTESGRQAVFVDPYSGDVTGTLLSGQHHVGRALPAQPQLLWRDGELDHRDRRRLDDPSGVDRPLPVVAERAPRWRDVGTRQTGQARVLARPARRDRCLRRWLHLVSGHHRHAWSTVWGSKVNELANGHNFGYPDGVRVNVPMSDARLAENAETAWSLEQAQLPTSADSTSPSIGLDRAVATFDSLGLAPGYAVSLPSGPDGVYTGSIYPDDLSRQRVVHLDQYSGEPLLDMRYADYGPLGRGLEWGINVHMGQQYGLANQLILALACAGIVLLCVSSGVMWWKRRPAGRMGVPPEPSDPRRLRGVLALLAIGGVIFPLVGASMIVMAVVDAWSGGGGRNRLWLESIVTQKPPREDISPGGFFIT